MFYARDGLWRREIRVGCLVASGASCEISKHQKLSFFTHTNTTSSVQPNKGISPHTAPPLLWHEVIRLNQTLSKTRLEVASGTVIWIGWQRNHLLIRIIQSTIMQFLDGSDRRSRSLTHAFHTPPDLDAPGSLTSIYALCTGGQPYWLQPDS